MVPRMHMPATVWQGTAFAYTYIYRHPDLTQQDAQTADYKYNNVL
jgi:hypothetical protein